MCFQRFATVCLATVLCVIPPCLCGCGKRTATVKGKVTSMGQVVPVGSIAFVGSGRTGSGTINPDGTYIVHDAPIGETTITVQTPPPLPGGILKMPKRPPGVGGMPKEMIPSDYQESKSIRVKTTPDKYEKADTSDLKYTVQPGTQDYDVELKP